jgi:hypothetical protein
VVQRTSSDLRLNPHLHVVFLDGTYHAQDGKLAWEDLGRLETREVGEVLERVVHRIDKHLRRHGLLASTDPDDTAARRGRSARFQATASLSSLTVPADQSTCCVGCAACRLLGSSSCCSASQLHHARDTRRRLSVSQVRLQRTQPQRLLGRTFRSVGREQRLRFDRIARPRAGAVSFHRVHVRRAEAGVR